jgi:hypothetical protein
MTPVRNKQSLSMIIGALLATLAVAVVYVWPREVDNSGDVHGIDSAYVALIEKNNKLMEQINHRDHQLTANHDTIIYRTKEVKNIIVEYRTIRDTVLKLQACDSLAVQCEALADKCRENDSLHFKQEYDLKKVIANKDTIISIQSSEIASLKKNKRRLTIGLAATTTALITSLIVR